jgi:hypothetical protein
MSAPALVLTDLAVAIEAEHQAAHQAARSALEHALQCGRLLLEAKERVEHGEWLPWLEANTRVGPWQAQKYMRLATAALEGKCDSASHLTIEGALTALADHREAKKHPIRTKAADERCAWFARHLVDRRAWALYLDADRQALADIAAFIGESEATTRALIRPSADPGWHWELEASPKDDAEHGRFHDLARRMVWPLIEYLTQSIRHHALWHAEEIRLYERREDLAPVLATLARECIARAESATAAMEAPLAELPERFVRGLYGAAAFIAVDACTGSPTPYRGALWHLVGQCCLASEPLGATWAQKRAAANPSKLFHRLAADICGASEVLAHVSKAAP